MEELKTVRKGLKRCLKIARIMLLEREYLRFITPDMEIFKKNSAASFLNQMTLNNRRPSDIGSSADKSTDKEPEMILGTNGFATEEEVKDGSYLKQSSSVSAHST